MSAPAVSIIVPTFNRADLLPRALDSIIRQTFEDWEIVLVDDGSTDDTQSVVAKYRDKLGDRFIALSGANQGSSAARNRGIDASRGRFVAFLDSDDEFLPRKLERQIDLFHRRPDLGLVYSDYAYIDLDGVRHESVFAGKCRFAYTVARQAVSEGMFACDNLFDVLIREYFIATIVGMVRREVLDSDIRFPEKLSYAEEWLFYLKIAARCPAGYIDEPLCLHHHQTGSLARTDRHQNNLRRRDLFRAMYAELTPLRRSHRREIRTHLSQACRQLGYDAHRTDRHLEAAVYFTESLRNRPGALGLYECLRAGFWWITGKSYGSPSGIDRPQEQPQPVR